MLHLLVLVLVFSILKSKSKKSKSKSTFVRLQVTTYWPGFIIITLKSQLWVGDKRNLSIFQSSDFTNLDLIQNRVTTIADPEYWIDIYLHRCGTTIWQSSPSSGPPAACSLMVNRRITRAQALAHYPGRTCTSARISSISMWPGPSKGGTMRKTTLCLKPKNVMANSVDTILR